MKMADRISDVVTRAGDTGKTGLADGSRVSKGSSRINAIGDVDELNSVIGVVVSETVFKDIHTDLIPIQNELFSVGAELAGAAPESFFLDEKHVERIERRIRSVNDGLSPLKEFILPGGSRCAALLHLARSVCRRAERSVVVLSGEDEISPVLIKYLNRLSDFFFVYARLANQLANRPDIYWEK